MTQANSVNGYALVNDLNMYYEIHGNGFPLVLIHGGGSTIGTNYGRVLPLFAQNQQVIAVELQAHGHTADRDLPSSFEQDADDVAALLKYLHINKADILGFSNGGQTAIQIAVRHPQVVNKLIIASAFYKRDGAYPQLWEFMPKATLENMPQPLQDAYIEITNDHEGLLRMHNRDRDRMIDFKDMRDDDIRSIQSSTLLLAGDHDVVKPEHLIEMHRMLPNSRVCILPGNHGDYIGEIMGTNPNKAYVYPAVQIIEEFLKS